MVRNMRAVLKKASWGTRCIFMRLRCKKQTFPVRKGYSVPKTAFSATRRIFKGPQSSRLHRLWIPPLVRDASSKTRRTADSTDCGQPLPHRTHLQCASRPPLGGEQTQRGGRPFWSTSSRKVILIYRRHGRHTVNFVISFVEKREMLTLTSSLSGER